MQPVNKKHVKKHTENVAKAALWLQAQRMANAFKVFKEDENVLKWHAEMQKGW